MHNPSDCFADAFNRFPNQSDMSHVVRIMAYMFPRQFGLHNVFTSAVDVRETAQPFKDYTMREEELRRHGVININNTAHQKIPKRLRGELPQLIRRLQRQHNRCSYKELLERYCPAAVHSPMDMSRRILWLMMQVADRYNDAILENSAAV